MITLITGTPGSGKTLYAVHRLIKEINSNPDRKIYSDIAGLKIEGVHPVPDDWREAEDGSLLIYDECQYRPMFQRGRGRTQYQAVVDLTTHRHTGKDIWLITQSPIFIHSDVLAVVGEHLHLDRPMGAKLANIYKWRNAEQKPQGRTVKDRAESRMMFKYDKDLFNYYSSVDVDDDKANHKSFKVPFSLYIYFVLGGGLLLFAFYPIYKSFIKPANEGLEQISSGELTTKKTQYDEMLEKQNNPAPADETNTNPIQVTDNGSLDKLFGSEQQANPKPNDLTPPMPELSQEQALYQKYLQPYTLEVGNYDLVRPAGVVQMGSTCRAYNQFGDLLNIDDKLCKSMLKEFGLKPQARQVFANVQELPPALQNNAIQPPTSSQTPSVDTNVPTTNTNATTSDNGDLSNL